jgi:hypothetical protein
MDGLRGNPKAVTAGLIVLLLGIVCLRSWVFLFFPHSHMDSDQAVFGLMAKDIALGRAFPLFMYGQRYMFAVGSWLCAPLFAIFGPSVTTLKLPMFGMNVACVVMMWLQLRREREMGPWGTALSILPFAASSVVVASRLVEHQGGNVEPIFFQLLAFVLRRHAVALGVVFGVAVLNREFAAIGFIALLMMDALQGTLRARYKHYLIVATIAAAIMFVVRRIAEGTPGYTGAGAVVQLQDPTNGEGFAGFFGRQLPTLLGAFRSPLQSINITSRLSAGHDWLYYLAAAWLLVAILSAVKFRRSDFTGVSTYLLLIGLGQAAAFILLCGAPRDEMLVRYILVSLCAWIGLTAYAWKARALRPWIALIVLTVSIANLRDHVRLAGEYSREPPQHENLLLTNALSERGVRYAVADFWIAYDVTWLTNERIILSPPYGHADRVARYHEVLAQHPDEVFQISERPCRHGEPMLRWYLCKKPPKNRR